MRPSQLTQDLAPLAGNKWALHSEAIARKAAGEDIIMLTIGEPDQPADPLLIASAKTALDQGRTRYSNGQGEPDLLAALVARYQDRSPTRLSAENFIALPGTQTALYIALRAIFEPGDEVLVGDPLYATYESVIVACGARPILVPLDSEADFVLRAETARSYVSDRTKALLINNPHNPTGAVLPAEALRALGDLAREQDLWIVADEVYETMIFDAEATPFASPWDWPDLQERSILVSSISKSHAAPGFRSGWLLASRSFCQAALPLAEALLFGNQPFIADATATVLSAGGEAVSTRMRSDYARRARLVASLLDGRAGLRVFAPKAGMFLLVEVTATGLDGQAFARRLLDDKGVAVMPGASFGTQIDGWLRLSLTVGDAELIEASARILALASGLITPPPPRIDC